MNVSEEKDIMDDITIAIGGYDVLGVQYIEPGPGFCGSFEITVGLEVDMDIICDELIGVCRNRGLDMDDWHSGNDGFVIPLYAYWDTLDE